MTDAPAPRRVDGVVLIISIIAVLTGTIAGIRSPVFDVDQLLYERTIQHMQAGDSYYDADAAAIREKGGLPPSEVRSVRTPVVALLMRPFPQPWWRWLATIPALALCLLSAQLAAESLLGQRLAAGFVGIWMVVSLPLLYLHQELWGAPLLVGAALALRRERDGLAAGLALGATAIRELFGLSLGVGLVLRSRRLPWLAALGVTGVGALVHAHFAGQVIDPDGFDPPLHAYERYTAYLGPGHGIVPEVIGVALLALAAVGFVVRRREIVFSYLGLFVAPLVVATAWSGRPYWALTWCGPVSAAAALTLAGAAQRLGWDQPAEEAAPG